MATMYSAANFISPMFTSEEKSDFPAGTFKAIRNGVLVRRTISLNFNDNPIGLLNRKYVVARRP